LSALFNAVYSHILIKVPAILSGVLVVELLFLLLVEARKFLRIPLGLVEGRMVGVVLKICFVIIASLLLTKLVCVHYIIYTFIFIL